MSHELAATADGRSAMAYTGETPWHGLGQSLPADADLDTWTVNAGMDFEIKESPVLFREEGDGPFADPIEFKGRKVLYRADTKAPLGDVSSGYRTVQPREVMEFFRGLTEASGFRMETAGVLYGGRKFWALARVTDDLPILDLRDKVGGFLLLSTSADGTMATQGRWTTVRVVCRNTLTMAIGKGANVSVPHRSRFDADAAKAALGLTGGDAREAFAEGMAMTGDGLRGSDLQGADKTAWAWVNAVTQYVDHMAGAKTASNRLDKAWFGEGERMKNKAFGIAAERSAPSQGSVDLAKTFGLVAA